MSPQPVVVGTELTPLPLPPISRTTLTHFADASGDANPIHLDGDVARAAGFEDVFAHGMLSMGYLGRLLTGWIPQARLRSFGARFVAIVPLYGKPVCTGIVRAIEEAAGGRLAIVDLTVTLADGTVVLRGDAAVALTSAMED